MSTAPSAPDLLSLDLDEMVAEAAKVRDRHHGNRVTYSPKVFIPLTMLCQDRCGYCTFAKAPARLADPYLSHDQVIDIARAGLAAGCHEALFTLGERPELRYATARRWLDEHGYASTVDYVAAMGEAVLAETGLLPHANAGALYADELAKLRPVAASQGMMLETLVQDLLGGEVGGGETGGRLGEGAVAAAVAAEHGEGDENLGRVGHPAPIGLVAYTAGQCRQVAQRHL